MKYQRDTLRRYRIENRIELIYMYIPTQRAKLLYCLGIFSSGVGTSLCLLNALLENTLPHVQSPAGTVMHLHKVDEILRTYQHLRAKLQTRRFIKRYLNGQCSVQFSLPNFGDSFYYLNILQCHHEVLFNISRFKQATNQVDKTNLNFTQKLLSLILKSNR